VNINIIFYGGNPRRSATMFAAHGCHGVLAGLLLAGGTCMAATTYYVSDATGNDASNGLARPRAMPARACATPAA
jgi:hypothetical protein